MRKSERRLVWLSSAFVAFYAAYSIANGVVATPLPINDPVLNYLQAAGFPAWAAVVAWGVLHITNEMRNFTQRLDAHIAQTNERLLVLEETIISGRKQI